MGELHLEVYIERMRREYDAAVETSPPEVAYRETVSERAMFNYTHRKQSGGAGQYGRVAGFIEPLPGGEFEFVDQTRGGVIPRQFILSVEKGFRSMLAKGRKLGAPVTGVRVVVDDGHAHSVDSSDIAFQEAARGAWREAYDRARPRILEPMMRVAVEGPAAHAGAVLASLMQRRGMIVGSEEHGATMRVEAEVPLAAMFGYSTALRSATQGQAEFSMELSRYLPLPEALAREVVARHQAETAQGGRK
jgi:elongation factor G